MAFAHADDDIVLPRGRLYFAPFSPGTRTPQASRLYIGNTPGFSLTADSSTLDHYTADSSVRIKDRSVVTEVSYKATLQSDNISEANLARFFMGTSAAVVQAAATGVTESFTGLVADAVIQLGVTATNPTGARNVSSVTIAGKVLGTDYELDAARGQIHVVTAGAYAVTYSVAAVSRQQVRSAGQQVAGALTFISDNPVGTNRDVYMPYVLLTPNGEFSMKGDGQAWASMSFNLQVMQKDANSPALYLDGQAA